MSGAGAPTTEDTSASSSAVINSSSCSVDSCTASIRAGSVTAWPSPSQMRAAAWWRVSATFSVTASAGGSSVAQWSSPIMAVLPATHSTRPTSLESATAPAAAPVGGYGVPENWLRRRASSAVTDAWASGSTRPSARASARRATAETADARRRRRLSCQGGGHTSTQAATEAAEARVHPSRRGPTAEAGWATDTGRMNVSSTAVVAVAAAGATMPAKSTAKPARAIATTAATLLVETTVPSTMRQLLAM
jgi:hypothetical protein